MEPSDLLAPLYQSLSSEPTALVPLEVLTKVRLPIATSSEGKLFPAIEGTEVPLLVGNGAIVLPPFPPLHTLFRGNRPCPEFRSEPPEEYIPLFATIEFVAADWCSLRGKPEYDEEFERLYSQLRRRPDGRDGNPLFGWLRRAAQLALLVRPTSEAEFEAVTRRLARSARTFRDQLTSTNYWQFALRPMLER